jgi:hypothetical protein
MCEERDIGARIFARKVCFGTDYEVRSFEVVEGREDLGRVEGWV